MKTIMETDATGAALLPTYFPSSLVVGANAVDAWALALSQPEAMIDPLGEPRPYPEYARKGLDDDAFAEWEAARVRVCAERVASGIDAGPVTILRRLRAGFGNLLNRSGLIVDSVAPIRVAHARPYFDYDAGYRVNGRAEDSRWGATRDTGFFLAWCSHVTESGEITRGTECGGYDLPHGLIVSGRGGEDNTEFLLRPAPVAPYPHPRPICPHSPTPGLRIAHGGWPCGGYAAMLFDSLTQLRAKLEAQLLYRHFVVNNQDEPAMHVNSNDQPLAPETPDRFGKAGY